MTTQTYNFSAFGAVGDGIETTAVLTILAGSPNLSSSTPIWNSARDTNKTIIVNGAGPNVGGFFPLVTTIQHVTDSQNIVLAANATTPMSSVSAVVAWGTDNGPAMASFHDTVLPGQGSDQIVLNIAAGYFLLLTLSASSGHPARGFKNIVFAGAGKSLTTISNGGNQVDLIFYGGDAIDPGIDNSVRNCKINTVLRGSNQVVLQIPGDASKFPVGSCALVAGFSGQSFGQPPNWYCFDYVRIVSANSSTGLVVFSGQLRYSYNESWPEYLDVATMIGKPVLWPLSYLSWDLDVTWRDMAFIQGQGNSPATNARHSSFTNFIGSAPTYSGSDLIEMTNCDIAQAQEADKLVTRLVWDGVTATTISFQNPNVDMFVFNNSTLSSKMNGTPRKISAYNSSVAQLWLGCTGQGYTEEIVFDHCAVSTEIIPKSVFEQGDANAGINQPGVYTMSNGVISFPNTRSVQRWVFPGANVMWRGTQFNETQFVVGAVTQDATNTYVQTSLNAGGFPGVPLSGGTGLFLNVHPAPRCSFISCTGCADAIDLSQAPPGAPIYTYSKRTYSDYSSGSTLPERMYMWGKIKQIVITVSKAYTGTHGTLTMQAMSQPTIKLSDLSSLQYQPTINLLLTGTRTITPDGVVTGAQSGDSGLTISEALWFANSAGVFMSSDISLESSSLWPVVTIEIKTDQGILSPSTVPIKLGLHA